MAEFESGAPTADPSAEQRQAVLGGAETRKDSAEGLENTTLKEDPELRGFRAFVAKATHGNSKILVNPKEAKIKELPPTAGSAAGLPFYLRRDGDIFADFTEGVLVTKDPQVIAWCEANPQICRDAADPRTRMWVQLKNMQTQTPSRDVTLDPTIDIDEELFPEGFDLTPRKDDVSGDDAIAAALSSRNSAIEVDAKESETVTGLS